MTRLRGHGWWPYLVPLFSFLLLGELERRVPESIGALLLVPRVLVPAALLVYFFSRGEYPELRTPPPGGPLGVGQDVVVGIAGAALWMAPYLWLDHARLPAFLRPDPGFDPDVLGAGLAPLALSLRLIGYGVVTPFAEELFVRGWLSRWLEVFDTPRDFRKVPIGSFSPRSFVGVVAFFTVAHWGWEVPVAFLWVVGTQLWFYHRRHLGSLVVVHAASNVTIFVAVLLAARQGRDLWYFL